MFRGIKYNYWTERMITHFESIHIDLWDVTKNGDYIPYDGQVNEIPRGQWTEEQKLRFLINSYAQNVMLCVCVCVCRRMVGCPLKRKIGFNKDKLDRPGT